MNGLLTPAISLSLPSVVGFQIVRHFPERRADLADERVAALDQRPERHHRVALRVVVRHHQDLAERFHAARGAFDHVVGRLPGPGIEHLDLARRHRPRGIRRRALPIEKHRERDTGGVLVGRQHGKQGIAGRGGMPRVAGRQFAPRMQQAVAIDEDPDQCHPVTVATGGDISKPRDAESRRRSDFTLGVFAGKPRLDASTMSAPHHPKDSGTPTPERQAALLTLLADDDAAISRGIREQLVAGGTATIEWLQGHRLHPDPATRRQVRGILDQFASARADAAFLSYIHSHGENLDLEEATWMFVRTRFPDAPVPGYIAQLDEWAARLREQMPGVSNGEEMLGRINSLLFGELGFRGNEEGFYEPGNGYLNVVMDRRLGIPISLSVVYLFVCRRLSLPVTGIGMPGHFLCRYQTPREEHYIDAYNGGALLPRAECLKRLKQGAVEYDEGAVLPISPRRILQRTIANLHLIHKQRRDRADAERLQRYLVALAR